MVKYYLVDFAEPKLRIDDMVNHLEFSNAIAHAYCNLYSRFGIKISEAKVRFHGVFPMWCVKVNIPDDFNEEFKPGNRLRGISWWFLHKSHYKEKYAKNKIGNRLLTYTEIFPEDFEVIFE